MENFRPVQHPGESRRRAHRIVFENPEDGQASITWNQQDSILLVNGGKVYSDAGLLITDVTPELLDSDIPEVDVDTGLETGRTIKGSELYSWIQSLYIFCATQVDQENTEIPNDVE